MEYHMHEFKGNFANDLATGAAADNQILIIMVNTDCLTKIACVILIPFVQLDKPQSVH